jgi:hypothetical protein
LKVASLSVTLNSLSRENESRNRVAVDVTFSASGPQLAMNGKSLYKIRSLMGN